MASQRYWLVKSEPTTYGIEHLKRDRRTPWTGVRNFQARNFMRDEMRVGDGVLFYHSNCAVPGVYGLARVASKPYPDETQFDPKSEYYDPRATRERPVWQLVDIAFSKALKAPVPLETIRATKALAGMRVLAKGNRLSITPVEPEEYAAVLKLAGAA
jgi:predicted RNA-binding protein with PUA-like domain